MKKSCPVWIEDAKNHTRCKHCQRPRDEHEFAQRDDGFMVTNVERRA